MKAHSDVFAVLSEHFREPNDYVEGLLEMARQFDNLSTEDLAEAILGAHPLPDWELGPVEGIARSLDYYFAVEPQENQYSSKTVQIVLHACFKAIRQTFKESSQKEAEKYLHSVCLIFHRLDPDFCGGRGSIQSFVRRCGRELDEQGVRFALQQATEDDKEFADLLALGLIERLGPHGVLTRYWRQQKDWSEPTDEDIPLEVLRTALVAVLQNQSRHKTVIEDIRKRFDALVQRGDIEAAKRITEEAGRTDLIGEFLPSYSEHTLGKRAK